MTAKPSIAVVLPTYNGERYLGETLASVLAQTRMPDEIVAVDDRSTDGTRDILQATSERSPVPFRLIVREQNSGGPAAPLNLGIRQSRADLVAVVEQDDLMAPPKLERFATLFGRCPSVGLAVSRYHVLVGEQYRARTRFVDDSHSGWDGLARRSIGDGFHLLDGAACYGRALGRNFAISLSNMVFRRSTLTAWGGVDEGLHRAIDHAVLLRALRQTQVGFIDEKLWSFRRHGDSAVPNTASCLWADDYRRIFVTEK